MNITKVFGFILALHVGVILVLFVQPGCRTNDVQPPSQSDYQMSALDSEDLASINSDLGSIYERNETDEALSGEDLSAFNDIDGFESENEELTVSVFDDSLDVYVVQNGDTLWDLAKRFDTTINELCKLNKISKDSILNIGMELEVPKVGDSVMSITKESAAVYQPTNFEGTGQVYEVVSGDSLSKIANQYDVSVAAIKATNGLSSDTIIIGQELLIPVDGIVEIESAEVVESLVEEKVVIEPIVDTAVGEDKGTGASLVEPAEPELKAVEDAEAEGAEIDMEAVPQVDYVRVPAKSE
ncbi:MAG: LysM peptidoglycan-binding domain-containing protein [Opitutae bacterium]|jgi:LysM repeat protein|nr:LysM peptidoglycan-binding domain-containing protein [Opitutae bacterium]